MLYPKDHIITYDSSRCTRCGSCLSVCPVDALHFCDKRDIFEINVDSETCIGCQKCVRVCPAAQLPERPLAEEDFVNMKRAVLAHASDGEVRQKSTSGGVARALAKAALELGWVDAVYCAVKTPEAPYAEGAFLTSPEEIDRISNSVYCAFPFNRNLSLEAGGRRISKLLYIGTNCQIQGAERFYRKAGVELVKVAIICKQQKTKAYSRWARRMMRQRPDDVAPIHYRGNGWPGVLRSGNSSYKNFFRPFAMQLWRVSGCRFCPNPWGEGSDFLLADPWNLVKPESGNPGVTMTILRTDRAASLWKAASGYVVEERELTGADVQKSMDWRRYQSKQARIPYFLGNEPSFLRRAFYGLHETQRAFYGWLFDALPVPEVVEKVLNRTLKK